MCAEVGCVLRHVHTHTHTRARPVLVNSLYEEAADKYLDGNSRDKTPTGKRELLALALPIDLGCHVYHFYR